MTGNIAPEETLTGFQIHNFKQSSCPGPDRDPTMLLLITPYAEPANWTQRKASVVTSTTDALCAEKVSGGMKRSCPTGGCAYGMPFHEATLMVTRQLLQFWMGEVGASYVPLF